MDFVSVQVQKDFVKMPSAMGVQEHKKDLEKFMRIFAGKFVQVIVQSRLGSTMLTKCKAKSNGSDWFNVSISDNPEVKNELKSLCTLGNDESIEKVLPLCVEISLRTVDDDTMFLELWCLNLQTDICDPTQSDSGEIYNRMGILVKSLIAISRATPAYKLSRKQGIDTYNIYYRVFSGQPDYSNLGEKSKQLKIGTIRTTMGTVNVSVGYRVTMTISPTQSDKNSAAIMYKSDHFEKEAKSPKKQPVGAADENKIPDYMDLSKPLKPGALVDKSKLKVYTEADFDLPATSPAWYLENATTYKAYMEERSRLYHEYLAKCNSSNTKKSEGAMEKSESETVKPIESTEVTEEKSDTVKSTEDVSNTSSKSSQSSVGSPFYPVTDSKAANRIIASMASRSPLKPAYKRVVPPVESFEPLEALLKKDLKCAFIDQSTPLAQLQSFYKMCSNAPPLYSSAGETSNTSAEKENEPIPNFENTELDLEDFSKQLKEFDSLVTSVCEENSKFTTDDMLK